MPKFYTIVTNQEGKQQVKGLESEIRHQAENEAYTIAQESGLQVVGVRKVQGTDKQPSTMLKYFTDKTPTKKKRK